MCGIVGYVGTQRRDAAADRRPQAPRVSRLRLGGRRDDERQRASRRGRRKGKISLLESVRRREPGSRQRRHRAHALGDARRAERVQRAPAHRLHGHDRGRPQRHHRELRRRCAQMLEKRGHTFVSETDTEVLAHLIEAAFDGNLEEAVIDALALDRGHVRHRRRSRARTRTRSSRARKGSPLLIGLGEGEYYVASDVVGDSRSTRARWSTSTTARWRC